LHNSEIAGYPILSPGKKLNDIYEICFMSDKGFIERSFKISFVYNMSICKKIIFEIKCYGIPYFMDHVLNKIGIEKKRKYSFADIYDELSDEKKRKHIAYWYFQRTGKKLYFNNLLSFNEKMQWLKLYDNNARKTQLADKYLVREYVQEKVGKQYLVKLLGVWDQFDNIDFSSLPSAFVLKANHGSGWNLIVKDKSKMNYANAKEKFDKWMKSNYFEFSVQYEYKNIVPKIIAEEYIENDNQELYDYKFWCFEGKAKYIMFLSNRNSGLKMSFYDLNWNKVDISYHYPRHADDIERPEKLHEMIDVANKLCQGFHHCRIDLYNTKSSGIKFGEITFNSYGGVCDWNPKRADYMLGSYINISEVEQ
jgi:hypothetical protein